MTYSTAKEFVDWFQKAKPGDQTTYYAGASFISDCEKFPALEKLRDTIWEAAFEVSVSDNKTRWHDKKTLFLIQRRVGQKPEGNKNGLFEYIAVKRGGVRS